MGEIKSAWELAMERAEKLGKLSPEELKRQKEDRYGSIGQALADKCLGGLAPWQLDVELQKYQSDERELVRTALVSRLVQAIELGNHGRLQRVAEVISQLKQDKRAVDEIKGDIEELFGEYEQAAQQHTAEADKSARAVLHQLRISGSAIEAINPKAIPEGRDNLNAAAGPYQERLEQLEQRLTSLP